MGRPGPVVHAQDIQSPVYLDDAPAAAAGLDALSPLLARQNFAEAARIAQRLLDDDAERLLPSPADPTLFVPVRDRVHRVILDSPELLAAYRRAEDAPAARVLASGDARAVERSRLLTLAGHEAALRVAQDLFESAQFDAAARVLAALVEHPDRAGPGAPAAAALAAQAAAYAASPFAWSIADALAQHAGLPPPPRQAAPEPVLARPAARTGLDAGYAAWVSDPGDPFAPAADAEALAALPPEPLARAPLTPDSILGPAEDLAPSVRALAQPAWVLPTAAGDVLYTNDGLTVAARDRFTLRPIWSFTASGSLTDDDADEWERLSRRRFTHVLEDTGTVTVAGDAVLVTTGRATSGRRAGDGRLHRLDRATGRPLWSVDPASLSPDLAELSIRGAPCVVGDTVVVVGRKNVRARRLLSVWMVGLDLQTGALRWARPLASAGALPFQQFNLLSEAPAHAGGVVYASDDLGVVAAVDAAMGRTLWARPFASDPARTNERVPPWNTALPVVTPDALVLMSPDRRQLLVLDPRTGVVRAQRDAAELGNPFYLVRVADSIACIGAVRVDFLDAADPARSRPRATRLSDQPTITGRASVAGRSLILPVSGGVEIIDPEQPDQTRRLTLDHTGNALFVEGQLVIIDDATIYSYLTWEAAAPMLRRRSLDDPDQTSAPTALTELAYRAGRIPEALEGADLAAAAADRSPDHAPRVFDALLAMVHDTLPESSPGPLRRDGNTASIEGEPRNAPPAGLGSLDAAAQMLDRVDRVARALPADAPRSAAAILARSALDHARGDARAAIDACHRVLADPALASSMWRGPRVSVRADVEARRRVELLVRAAGPGVAAHIDAAARAAADALPAQADAAAIERLAGTFPAASCTPGLWLRAAGLHARAGADLAALRAARAGLRAAQLRPDAPEARDAAPELLGRFSALLIARGHPDRARAEAARLAETFATPITPTLDGVPVPLDAASLASDTPARPRVGTRVSDAIEPVLLPGRALEPLTPAARTDAAILIAPGLAGGSLVGVLAGGPASERGSPLQPLPPRVAWTRPVPVPASPLLVRVSADDAVVLWPRALDDADDADDADPADPANPLPRAQARAVLDGGFFESIDLTTGATRWTSPTFDSLARAPRTNPDLSRVLLPDGSPARPDDLFALVEGATAVLVERTGRVAAFDLATGAPVWHAHAPITTVTDAAIGGGYLLLAGRLAGTDDRSPSAGAVVLDALSGRVLHALDSLTTPPRWARATPDGEAFLGLSGSVLALSLDDAQIRWIASDEQIGSTDDAWLAPGHAADTPRLLVADADWQLWSLDAATGRLDPSPLETYGVHTDRTALRVEHLPATTEHPARTILASGSGVVILDPAGAIIGSDSIGADAALLPAAPARGLVVVVEPDPLWRRPELTVHALDDTTARVLGTSRVALPPSARLIPESCALVDHWALIGFGGVTLALPMPPE